MISSPSLLVQGTPDWTPRRQQLHDRLAELASPLAGLYASGVFFLASPTWPGRYHLLGHSVREIVQRLPEFLDPQPRSRAKNDEALKTFVDAWLGAGLPTTGTGFARSSSELREEGDNAAFTAAPIPEGRVAVPSNVVEAAAALVAANEQISATNYGKAASIILVRPASDSAWLIEQTTASRDATVLLWTETAKWFMKFTHVSVRQEGTFPADDELRHRFEVIESTLEAILAPFYQVIDDLDRILGAANTPTEAADAQEFVGSAMPDREG
jgi:hypothetical protein